MHAVSSSDIVKPGSSKWPIPRAENSKTGSHSPRLSRADIAKWLQSQDQQGLDISQEFRRAAVVRIEPDLAVENAYFINVISPTDVREHGALVVATETLLDCGKVRLP
jgi:hypothetical protein